MLYNQGKWAEAETELQKTMNHLAELSSYLSALVLLAWINWKRNEKAQARYLWAATYENDYIKEIDCVSAMCGLAIYHSELEGESAKERTQSFIDKIKMKMKGIGDLNVATAVQMNSLGIALAKIGNLDEADSILREAARMNEAMETLDDSRAIEAMLNRAKNGYNRCNYVLIPGGALAAALKELTEEIVPRYVKVGAETDLAAAYHRISDVYVSLEEYATAYIFEEKSAQLWKKHFEDDPKRLPQALKNLQRIKELGGMKEE